jgi:hypothetical protein
MSRCLLLLCLIAFVTDATADEYRWSVGAEAGLAVRSGPNSYDPPVADAGIGGRFAASYILVPSLRFGGQLSLSYASFKGPTGDLSITEAGFGLYGHIRLAPHLYLTPLAGLSVPVESTVAGDFIALGIHARIELDLVLGHSVVTFALPDLAQYTSPFSGGNPSLRGPFVEDGFSSVLFSIGYTFRQ